MQAGEVIPITIHSMVLSSPHVAAWFWCFSVRFTTVPVGVFWKRIVSPDKLAHWRVPLQSDPNLFHRRGVFINQVQNKLVFFIAVDLHKISAFAFAVRSSSLPTFDCATHKVTVAFEMRPAQGRDLYNWWWKNGIGYCLLLYYKVQKIGSKKYKNKYTGKWKKKKVSSLLIIRKAVSVASLLCLLSDRAEKEIKPTIKKTSWEKVFF